MASSAKIQLAGVCSLYRVGGWSSVHAAQQSHDQYYHNRPKQQPVRSKQGSVRALWPCHEPSNLLRGIRNYRVAVLQANSDDCNKLVIAEILHSIFVPGEFQFTFGPGGRNMESSLSSFTNTLRGGTQNLYHGARHHHTAHMQGSSVSCSVPMLQRMLATYLGDVCGLLAIFVGITKPRCLVSVLFSFFPLFVCFAATDPDVPRTN